MAHGCGRNGKDNKGGVGEGHLEATVRPPVSMPVLETISSYCRIASISQLAVAASDLDKLLIQNLPPLKKPATASPSKKLTDEPYDRTAYWNYAKDSKAAFKSLYSYCFTLAKSR